MVSEKTVLHVKLAEGLCNYPCLYDKSSDDFKDTNKKNFAGKMIQKHLVQYW